jgi:integrase/recombinase XerD
MNSLATQTATTVSEQLVNMWLHGKSPCTAEYYRLYAKRFLEFVGKPLHLVTLAEVQGFATFLEESGLAVSTQYTILAAIKSLLSFGNKTGVLPVNVGALLTLPKATDSLSERILSELEVQTMIVLETNPRNRALLRLLYLAGLRVSELCQLQWKNLQSRGESGQVTVKGKGSKTRSILLPKSLWVELMQLRGEAAADEPVFRSRKGNQAGHLTRERVHQIVKAAAKRAGIEGKVSPHWLRHAHATHALERGAKIHLVADTLGHSSVAVTGRYLHARPEESSSLYLPG